jgi:hypothetical protein
LSASASVNKTTPNAIRLTPTKIAQCRKDGKCFCCDEFFTNDHKAVCKQLFSIEVIDDDVDDPGTDSTEPTISIHALTGIQSCHNRTMQLQVVVNDAYVLTLLDSGSTHNFINTKTTTRLGIVFTRHGGLRITVANGNWLTGPGCCRAMSFMVDDEAFNIDFYGLTLGSFEIVQWLESLGPILCDFGCRTIAFICDGHRVLWAAPDTATAPPTSLLVASSDIMEDLDKFDPMFAATTGFSPPRARAHQI